GSAPSSLRRRFVDVGPRSWRAGRMACAPQHTRGPLTLAGAGDDPRAPVFPPGTGTRLGARQPLVSADGIRTTGEVAGLGAGRRSDDALHMAGPAEHEFARAAQELRRGVARLPRDDVVRDAGQDEGVTRDLSEVDRRAQDRDTARLLERVRR